MKNAYKIECLLNRSEDGSKDDSGKDMNGIEHCDSFVKVYFESENLLVKSQKGFTLGVRQES